MAQGLVALQVWRVEPAPRHYLPSLWWPETVMGVTHYVTMTTREYVLLARLEGQVRALLATATVYGDNSQAARGVLKTTIDQLDTSRNGGKPK